MASEHVTLEAPLETPLVPDTGAATGVALGYPVETLELVERFIDDVRPLRVAVIGAGLAGITAGVLLPVKVPGIELTIFDKNADVGGTWFENIYPGVRCDIPAHVYQATFAPNTQWTEQFAQGSEILQYWKDIAKRYDVYRHLKLSHRVNEAVWDDNTSTWAVNVTNLAGGETAVHTFDFVLTAIGRFNDWRLPDYPGLTDFKGVLRHASNWDPIFDPAGKAVAVIGNGASGIQLVPNLQPIVSRLDHYARNKTWIAGSWAGDERTFEPQYYSEEQRESFKDPATYLAFRKELEDKYWRRFAALFRGSGENAGAREHFTQLMRERSGGKLDDLIPDFSPNCRRPTPGPRYLESLTEPNVDYIRTPIARFTATGIETVDGKHREVDAIICATGANIDMAPPFPIRARRTDLKEAWKDFPHTYMGLATPGFPNLLFIHGPHGTGASGTVPQSVEVQLTYFAKLLRKASREGVKTIEPSQKATDEFAAYNDAFFARTVLSDPCSSWYNGGKTGGRVHGLFPGSAAHVTAVRREPRWEDWEYTYLEANRFAWYFGNGWSRREQDPDADMTPYLAGGDLRDLHESWWSLP
ncbi:FAD/NAD(P)-binding domain-containing protein [Trichodelitschia bisporula]|uniref:FAD/NAD(P)-binding domain-containing protein n=1 Tax=Trichodelitschia bisporula TaxID=703511 RepID=A0A6G1HU30_9PEZI|nr:FAD/NAD(P)-binding domain-containing protein [Trichodelitschia bisporula]